MYSTVQKGTLLDLKLLKEKLYILKGQGTKSFYKETN